MTVEGLISAQLGTGFVTDPLITLSNFLKNNWVITDPAVSEIHFDTKLERFDKYQHVICENIIDTNIIATLGQSRISHDDVKRIQVIGYRKNARDQVWKMKERIESLINANPRHADLLAGGIEQVKVLDYQEITGNVQYDDVEQPDTKMTGEYKGRFLVQLHYDKCRV